MGSKSSTPQISLPSELYNEPFSYEDNNLRPEIIVKRPSFNFLITDIGEHIDPCCLVGYTLYRKNSGMYAGRVPQKNTSYFSVVSVYDTYGLEITCSYLEYLKTVKYRESPTWTEMYLECSIIMFNPGWKIREDRGTLDSVCGLCCYILSELKRLDSLLPRSLSWPSDISLTLPIEIVSKIIASNRVSKKIRSDRKIIPSYYQMINYRYSYLWTCSSNQNDCILVGPHNIARVNSLSLNRDKMEVTMCRTYIARLRVCVRVQNSLLCYENYMKDRDTTFVLNKLEELKSRLLPITSINFSEACSWLLLLSYDAEAEHKKDRVLDRKQLGRELERLLDLAIEKRRQKSA